MKSRRFWVSIITVAIYLSAFGSVLLGAEDVNQKSELQTLQTKIDSLEKTIKAQQKQLDEQIKENKRLQLLCQKAGIDTTKESGSASKPIGHIIYRGKERDEDWFNRMYARFSDKIGLLDGKFVALRFVDIGKLKDISESPLPVGAIIQIPSECKVLSVIGDGEFLLVIKGGLRGSSYPVYTTPDRMKIVTNSINSGRGYGPDFFFHVTGYDGPSLSDDQIFPYTGKLVCAGTYKYTGILFAQNTVQSFKVWKPEPLTREQFAEAISSGFELETIGRPIR